MFYATQNRNYEWFHWFCRVVLKYKSRLWWLPCVICCWSKRHVYTFRLCLPCKRRITALLNARCMRGENSPMSVRAMRTAHRRKRTHIHTLARSACLGFGGESCFGAIASLCSLYHTFIAHCFGNGIAFYLANEMNSVPKSAGRLSVCLRVCGCAWLCVCV